MAKSDERMADVQNCEIWLRTDGDGDLIEFYDRLHEVSPARAKKAFVTLLEAVRASGKIHMYAFCDPNAKAAPAKVGYRKIRLQVDASQYRGLARLWREIPRRSRSMQFIALLRTGLWRYGDQLGGAQVPLRAMVPGSAADIVPEPQEQETREPGAEKDLPAPSNEYPDEDPGWPGDGAMDEALAPLQGEEDVAVAMEPEDDIPESPEADEPAQDAEDDDEADFAPYDDVLDNLLRSANDDPLFDSEN